MRWTSSKYARDRSGSRQRYSSSDEAVGPSIWTPVPKVSGGAAGAAVTIVLVWVLEQFVGLRIPGYVASALTTIIAFSVGYLIPAGKRRHRVEVLSSVDDPIDA